MEQYEVIDCPKCHQKLRLPSHLGLLSVKCPECQFRFLWEHGKGIITEHSTQHRATKTNYNKIILPISLILLMGLVLIIYYSLDYIKSPVMKHKEPKWITISYKELIDDNAIIRTGQTLKSAIQDPNLKGTLQPFLSPYSFLLQHSIEMLSGPEKVPFRNVADAYPLGSPQPAWVSICRGGRIQITTDYQNHARIFLLGDDPEKSYQTDYSLIRHCFNALLSPDGSPLNVEVFAYRNDYEKEELRLNLNPYSFSASSFPPKGVPLDITGLATFFDANPEIQGAKIDRSKGLILYGKQGGKQTLAGANISLSDLAVAYRAVFHAGDNEAFISLDPNADPTKVTVNFGGYLENTRIGSVVLEADKRFKTITSGLDPNKFNDLRQYTRKHISSFMSVDERDLIDSTHLSLGKWIKTRFWFYPDSIGIESDLNYQYAMITNPIFMADAERSKDDFASPEEFQRKKNTTLSPSIRHNIDHLNQNYFQYAQAFSELKELTTVARLMGICSWLYKANPQWLDLDALLSVELPTFTTPRERTQLIATCFVSYSASDEINEDYVLKKSKVVYLSPILDKQVNDFFKNGGNYAKYLCIKNGEKEKNYRIYEAEASQLFKAQRNLTVKEIVKNREDLRALASYAAHSLGNQKPSEANLIEKDIRASKENIESLKSEIEQIRLRMSSIENPDDYNELVDQHNKLIYQYKVMLERHNRAVNIYKSFGRTEQFSIIEIGGGINLEPRNFKIKTPPSSARLQGIRGLLDKVGTEWRSINGAGKWIRNETGGTVTEVKNKFPKMAWIKMDETTSGSSTYKHFQSDKEHQYWSSINPQTGSWRDCRKIDRISYQERSYEGASKKFQIAKFSSGKFEGCIVGLMEHPDRIVFRKSERKDLLKPKDPPIWFNISQSN
jgi:hypothetical protein